MRAQGVHAAAVKLGDWRFHACRCARGAEGVYRIHELVDLRHGVPARADADARDVLVAGCRARALANASNQVFTQGEHRPFSLLARTLPRVRDTQETDGALPRLLPHGG